MQSKICYFAGAVLFSITLGAGISFPAIAQQPTQPATQPQASDAATEKLSSTTVEEIVNRYPAGSIQSVPSADAAISDLSRQRKAVEAQWVSDQYTCTSKFFTTSCLDKARERRRVAIASLHPIELEANAFKRRAKVEQRDSALDEKNKRSAPAGVTEEQASPHEKTLPDSRSASASSDSLKHKVPHHGSRTNPDQRIERAEKANRATSIDPATEARNQAAFDKKASDSAQRQKEIADKKAQKEQERLRKQAEKDAAAQTRMP